MKRVLFLTYRMAQGYGVDVVVHNLARAMEAQGARVLIGCLDADGFYPMDNVLLMPPDAQKIRSVARALAIDVIVAHTFPYHELLPALADEFDVWLWEYGDPTPSFFEGEDYARRQAAREHKLAQVYPRVNGVVAISEFIRHDAAYSPARVIYLGCDHMADPGPKTSFPAGPLRVGGLMRLGASEARYKGQADFLGFARALGKNGNFRISVMGRGSEEDARAYRELGVEVRLNASEREKHAYLRGLDVFLSFSEWEGFDLPLVEAQALGTMALASDRGAHPEVCPHLFANAAEAARVVGALAEDRADLGRKSRIAYEFVRTRFRWDQTGRAFLALLGESRRETPLPPEADAQMRYKEGLYRALSRLWRPKTALHVLKNKLRGRFRDRA